MYRKKVELLQTDLQPVDRPLESSVFKKTLKVCLQANGPFAKKIKQKKNLPSYETAKYSDVAYKYRAKSKEQRI